MRQLFALIVLATLCITQAEFTAHDCRGMGFIKGQLMCSTCEKLNDFGLETLKPHCKECCTQDKLSATQHRYPKAILEVCTCKFRAYPQIQAFIKSGRPAKFSNLQIKYVRGLDPIVKLLDASGIVKETLSITKWNTDTVEEFFETHLEMNAATSAAAAGTSSTGKSSYSVVVEEDDDDDDFLKSNQI